MYTKLEDPPQNAAVLFTYQRFAWYFG